MAATNRPLGVEIARTLKAHGVDVVFGIPGVHNIELYRGLEAAGLTHVLARHEQGAGFMADGYARATGKPGVAFVITGPGLCNIMTPMGQAYADSVPMLVISSCLDETAAKQGQLHQMKDQCGAAACVCDWSQQAQGPDSATRLLDRAFAEFASQRPRPKHIQVPIADLSQPVGTLSAPMGRDDAAQTPVPGDADHAKLAMLLARARRPLIILGGGIRPQPKFDFGAKFSRLGIASFTTYAGRGLIADDEPLHFGATLGRPDSEKILASADLVVAVGTELSETDLWRDTLGHRAQLVRIDTDPAVLQDRHNAAIAILGDGTQVLAKVFLALKGQAQKNGWSSAEVASARSRWRAEADADRPGIVPVCDAIRAVVPGETIFYSDMTQFAYVATEAYPMPLRGARGLCQWHHPTGFGTLGYAVPAAIGGKIARPDAPVIAIAGDYGFQYTMPELGVAVELGLSLPILLWDNGKLKEIEDCMSGAQIAPTGVVARNPDFMKLASAFGARSAEPGDLAAFRDALADALAANLPTLIRVTPAISG